MISHGKVMKIVKIVALLFFSLLSSSIRLSASTITETFSGTLSSGIDNVGIFGPKGASLAGDTATVTYMLNAPLLAADGLYQTISPTEESLYATANDGALSESITVNGITFTQTTTAGGQEQITTEKVGTGSLVSTSLYNSSTAAGMSFQFQSTAPYQYPTLLSNPQSFLNQVTAAIMSVSVGIDTEGGNFETDIVITPGATVGGATSPEPSSFGLVLLAGLAVLPIRFRGLGQRDGRNRRAKTGRSHGTDRVTSNS